MRRWSEGSKRSIVTPTRILTLGWLCSKLACPFHFDRRFRSSQVSSLISSLQDSLVASQTSLRVKIELLKMRRA